MEFVHLVGTEQISTAASQMRQAAEEMTRAASSIAQTVEMHRELMESWVARIEAVAEDIHGTQ